MAVNPQGDAMIRQASARFDRMVNMEHQQQMAQVASRNYEVDMQGQNAQRQLRAERDRAFSNVIASLLGRYR